MRGIRWWWGARYLPAQRVTDQDVFASWLKRSDLSGRELIGSEHHPGTDKRRNTQRDADVNADHDHYDQCDQH